jgi:hypothetical protein
MIMREEGKATKMTTLRREDKKEEKDGEEISGGGKG